MRQSIYSFFRFIVVGCVNTGIGYGIIFGGMYLLNLSPEVSNILGYGFGLVVAYILHRYFTFQSEGLYVREFTRFIIMFLIAFILNFITLLVLVRFFGINKDLSQLISGIIYVISTYIMSNRFVFVKE